MLTYHPELTSCAESGCGSDCPGGGVYMSEHWDECPVSELGHPQFTLGLGLLDLAEVSPIAGWPDAFVAWVPETVVAIKRARQERRAQQSKEQ